MLWYESSWLLSIWIGVGGFLGTVSRYYVSQIIPRVFPSSFPYATLFINLVGSFLLGGLVGADIHSTTFELFFGVGFLGAFTTFSTLNYESLQLGLQKQWTPLLVYLGVTYSMGIIFAFAGYLIFKIHVG